MFFENSKLPNLLVSWALKSPPAMCALWVEIDCDKNDQFAHALDIIADRLSESEDDIEIKVSVLINNMLAQAQYDLIDGSGTSDAVAIDIDGNTLFVYANSGHWRVSCAEQTRSKYYLLDALSKYLENALV